MRNWLSAMELKLAIRMLLRYPGLSLVGAFGIAVVIAFGAGAGMFDALLHSTLPFDPGRRVVAIENWDTERNAAESRAVHDFATWRDQLTSIEDVGAYRLVSRNLTLTGRAAEPVRVAEISAAAFRMAQVQAVLGRSLIEEDEHPGADPVIVIGHEEWQRRFGGDPQVVGRTVQLTDSTLTIVGVMPEGFAFPVREQFWIPLRVDPAEFKPREGPELYVFGRLADGHNLGAAQAELTTVGDRAAADFPVTHARLRPRVLPYTEWFFYSMQQGELYLLQALVSLLLVVVCANVAALVYARTAARRVEIAVRTALGASRRRIVGQMFVEGLALSAPAAILGLAIAGIVRRELTVPIQQAPFWVDLSLTSGPVITYTLVLVLFGGLIVGVVPALQATSRRAQVSLQQATASLATWRFSRAYSLLMVAQVALAVAILPAAITTSWFYFRYSGAGPGFAAGEYLVADVSVDADLPPAARIARQQELMRRLEAETALSDVFVMNATPGHEAKRRVDVDGADAPDSAIVYATPAFFEAFDVPILAGRALTAADAAAGAGRAVIVNRQFAQAVFGGANPIGRRVRLAAAQNAPPEAWSEIVGVAANFPPEPERQVEPRIYHAVAVGDARADMLTLRIRGGEAAAFAGRLREIATDLDRSIQLRGVRTLDEMLHMEEGETRIAAMTLGLITSSVFLLSAAGLYALMAFTVVQRRREVGIRIALGADRRQVISGIFARTMLQLVAGVLVGLVMAGLMDAGSEGELTGGLGVRMLPVVIALLLMIGIAAAAGPTIRALRIQPTEALREE